MGGVVKAIKNVIDSVVDAVEDVVDFVVETVETVVEFAVNVVKGVVKAVTGMIKGIVTGDWVEFRDSFLGTISTVIYGFAIATGNPWLIAAGIVALDGQYNEARLTAHVVRTIGKLERELLGSENILENLDLITGAIVVVGSLGAGIGGGIEAAKLLSDISFIQTIVSNQYFQVGMGIYSIADAYMQFQEAQGLYDSLMSDYQQWLQEVGNQAKYFNQLWDTVYSDPDILYEAQPGGYLFNSAAGSDEYSVSSIHEQSSYLLGIDTNRDNELDRYVSDPTDIDYVSLNISNIEPDVIKYEI